LIAPLTYSEPVKLVYFGWKIDTLAEALFAPILGLGVGVVSIHLINGIAFMQGQFARLLLGSSKASSQ
jgi:hypothetical protein